MRANKNIKHTTNAIRMHVFLAVFVLITSTAVFIHGTHAGPLQYCSASTALPHDFETGFDGWTPGGSGSEWETGTPQGDSCAGSSTDPSTAFSGSGIVGLDIGGGNGCYSNNADTYLTSPVFDCSDAVDNVKMRFHRWLGVENASEDVAAVEVNIDGGGWTELWSNGVAEIEEINWGSRNYEIPGAAGSNSVQVRFRLTSGNGGNYSGWNIDFFELFAVDEEPGEPGSVSVSDTPSDTGNSIDITWTASYDDGAGSNDVAGYEVLRKQGISGIYSKVHTGTLPAGTTAYTDNAANSVSAPSNNIDYYYIVRVIDGSGQSVNSVEAGSVQALDNSSTPEKPVLSSPTGGVHFDYGTPSFVWDVPADPDGDQLHFKIEISRDPSFYSEVYEEDFTTTGNRDAGATTADWITEEGKLRLTAATRRGSSDQGSTEYDLFYADDGETNVSQSFVPSFTQRLYSVQIFMKKRTGGSGAVTMEIRGENGNEEPDSNILATASSVVSNNAGWYEFVFSDPPVLQGGEKYTFVMNHPSVRWFVTGDCCSTGGNDPNPYPGGIVTASDNNGLTFTLHSAYDHAFVTYAADFDYSLSTQAAQSVAVVSSASAINTATLYAGDDDNGQTINYFMSADGGANWEPVTPGTTHNFTNTGTSLKWKVELKTTDKSVSPEISNIEIRVQNSDSVLSAESKDDVTGFTGPPPLDEGTGQAGYTVQAGDTLPDGLYYWRVAAWDGTQYGPWSTESWDFVIDTSGPDFDGLVQARNGLSGGDIILEWDAADDLSPPVTYNIYRSRTSGFSPGTANRIASGVASLEYTDSGLLADTTYYYIVKAVDDLGHEDGNMIEKNATTEQLMPSGTCVSATDPLPHNFDVVSDQGWSIYTTTSPSTWERGEPLGGSAEYGLPDPDFAPSPDNVWGNNLAGQYENNKNEYLLSPSFDCTGLTDVMIRYNRWLNVQHQSDNAEILVTDDNFNSTDRVYSTKFGPSKGNPEESVWHYITVDISGTADNDSDVRVAFRLDSNGSDRYSGWNIDDFTMVGVDETEPDFDGIQSVTDAGTDGELILGWNAADDTNSSSLVYNIYMSTTPGGQDFNSAPQYQTTSTSFTVSGLTNGTEYFFVVRVVDPSGNEDGNTVEKSAVPTRPDNTPPAVGPVTVYDTDTGSFVDAVFNISATFTDGGSGLEDGSAEYYCSGSNTTPTCNGTWQQAGDNWTGTASSGGGTALDVQCIDGDFITINMRVSDETGNVGEGVAITRTCDASPPDVTEVGPAGDVYQPAASVTGGDTTCSDAGAGLDAAPYDVQWCASGTSKGNCGPGDTWNDTSPAGWNSANDESFSGAGGNWYRFRARCRDLLDNVSGYEYSTGYVLVDQQPPYNPAVNAYDSASKNELLDSGVSYSYAAPDGPYFEWLDPDDNPAAASAGINGYYVYFGTDPAADPSSFQPASAPNSYTNPASLSSGTEYYLRIKTEDAAGNVSSAQTLFTYRYSVGAYLHTTADDDDGEIYGGNPGSDDEKEGVVYADGSDFEIVTVELYDEWDEIIERGAAAQKTVNVELTNVGLTGMYITETNLAGASTGGTSAAGALSNGTAWLKVRAGGAAQDQAVTVTVSSAGLSGISGRDQVAYIIVSDRTYFDGSIEEVYEDRFSPIGGGTVMHPVWSHAGDAVVVAARRDPPHDGWNLYKLEWTGADWGAPVRLTNNDMCVQPHSRYTFSGDDSKVVFAARPGCTVSSAPGMYAVDAAGADAGMSIADLAAGNKELSNGSGYWWWDAEWNRNSCAANGDRLLLSMMSMSSFGDIELYMMYGPKNSQGLPTETGSTIEKVTDIGGGAFWSFHGSWSNDCSQIVFATWDGYSTQHRTGIYIIDLDTASLPVTSINDPGVITVHECDSASCPNGSALYPAFTANDTMISYMTDPASNFSMYDLILNGSTKGGDIAGAFFGAAGVNFDNYVEYILDQPVFSPQLLGQSANNEFGLVQCAGPSCPASANGNMFTYITQRPGTREGSLAFLELGTRSTVTANGGLLFYEGSVTAVIPPGSINMSEVKLQVDAPSSAPASPDGKDLLVSVGEAREFFPDGIIFDRDIRLVFHYCDADGDGFLDNNQDAACSGGGNSAIDENKLYVYYWCENSAIGCSEDAWNQLNGSIDADNNNITVAINHFSKYDMKALTRGRFAPNTVTPLHLSNPRTYPNPWRTGQPGITFAADAEQPGGSSYNHGNMISIQVQVYDVRGGLVRNIFSTHAGDIPVENGSLSLAKWDARNNSGRRAASGVYLYLLKIDDGVYSRKYKGKLTIVR